MTVSIFSRDDTNSHCFILRATSHAGRLGEITEKRDGTVRFVGQDGLVDTRIFQSVDEALVALRTELNPDDAR